MNINPTLWQGLGGINKQNAGDPRINIRAGVSLIRRLMDRVENPNIRKIAALYHFVGQERTSKDKRGYAARVAFAYRNRLWEKESISRADLGPIFAADPNLGP